MLTENTETTQMILRPVIGRDSQIPKVHYTVFSLYRDFGSSRVCNPHDKSKKIAISIKMLTRPAPPRLGIYSAALIAGVHGMSDLSDLPERCDDQDELQLECKFERESDENCASFAV